MTENDYENKLEAALDSFQQTADALSTLKGDYREAIELPKRAGEMLSSSVAPIAQAAASLMELKQDTLQKLDETLKKIAEESASISTSTTSSISTLQESVTADTKALMENFRTSVSGLEKELGDSRNFLEATFKNGVDQMLTPFRETCREISRQINDSNQEVIGNFKTTQGAFLDANASIRKTGDDCADLLKKFMEETKKYRDSLSKVDDSIQSICATQMELEKSQKRVHLFTIVNFLAILATIGVIFYLKKEGLA